jgi:hypothetical protein
MFQLCLVLKAIIAGQAAHQLAALPLVEDSGDVLACNAGHRGEVSLPDLLTDDDPPWPNFLPEMVGQLEQRLGNPSFEGWEAGRRHHLVSLAHAFSGKPEQRLAQVGMSFCKRIERSAAEEAQFGIAHRDRRVILRIRDDLSIPDFPIGATKLLLWKHGKDKIVCRA